MSRAPIRGRQRGIVLLVYMVGMLAVVGMAGFALDLGLAMLTKTRLQNALDAAALDGAKTLFASSGSMSQAEAAAKASFAANIAGTEPAVAFSSSLPFSAGLVNPRYVQVTVATWPVNTYLSRVMGLADSYSLAGSAMAGPQALSGPLCGAPLGICAAQPGSADTNCANGDGCFGLGVGEMTLHDDAIAAGNYGLLDMGSGAGPNGVANGMAGGGSLCMNVGQSQNVQPGMANTIINATNSRFGSARGAFNDPDTYPPDQVTLSVLYPAYELLLQTGPHQFPNGTPKRRTLLMPVIDCSQPMAGASQPVTVLGHACMFLTRPVTSGGSSAGTVYAQIIDECLVEGGVPDPDGSGDSGAARIVLFKSGAQG